MDHSYEEIRAAVLDILAGREINLPYESSQYGNLAIQVAEVFVRRENPNLPPHSRQVADLRGNDAEEFMEVFWDLFREGVITLGLNQNNREFPFFRLSRMGKRLVANQDTYFFHDVTSYSKLLTAQVPAIDSVTLLYVKEALQSFRAGCMLSSMMMLGVATEHTFLLLLEAVDASPTHASHFAAVGKERTILPKLNKFRSLLEPLVKSLPPEVKEDLDTHFAGILSIIRAFRNQSGHPTGKIPDRDQAYVLLNLFVPYCRKMYQLRDHLSA